MSDTIDKADVKRRLAHYLTEPGHLERQSLYEYLMACK